MSIPHHPLADLFPLIEGTAFEELVADIRENGLREEIVLLDGMILDGRNRYLACVKAAVEPRFKDAPAGDPLSFVISANLVRRQLRDSQRALIAARLADMRPGRPTTGARRLSQSEAAHLFGVRERSVRRARTVLQECQPEIIAQVERGALSLHAAAEASKRLTPAGLAEIAANPRAIVAAAHGGRRGGHRGRAEFAELWKRVDQVCASLEHGRLGEAGVATRQLLGAIELLAKQRSGQ